MDRNVAQITVRGKGIILRLSNPGAPSAAGVLHSGAPVSQTAAYLFIPYFFWVSFAGALNFAVWRMNP